MQRTGLIRDISVAGYQSAAVLSDHPDEIAGRILMRSKQYAGLNSPGNLF